MSNYGRGCIDKRKSSLMFNIYFKEMKKFFSLIALVGVFAACNPEDMTTAFQVAPAEVTLNATAVCAEPGYTGASISYSPAQTVTGTPVLSAGSITATATYNGATGTSTVDYPMILAGGSATLNTVVFIPYTPGDSDYEFTVEEADSEATPQVFMLANAAHGHGTADSFVVTVGDEEYEVPMLENANEFVLLDSYSYTEYEGAEFVDGEVYNDDFADTAKKFFDDAATKEIKETKVTKDFSVSAWALYNVIQPVVTTVTSYNIVATPKAGANTPALADPVIASFKMKTVDGGAQFVEMAHPDHVSHYEAGHGHGHGSGSNAGGGLVEAE